MLKVVNGLYCDDQGPPIAGIKRSLAGSFNHLGVALLGQRFGKEQAVTSARRHTGGAGGWILA
jgi:hypothetical protein